MSDQPPTSTFYVGWTEDLRTFQLLGPQEAEKASDAIKAASKTHGKEGRYIAMPAAELTQRDVAFDCSPVLSKPTDPVAPVDPEEPTPPEPTP
jgi:hypothetical protein